MNYEIKKYDNYAHLAIISEKFDITIAPEIKTALVELKGEGIKSIILDVQKSKYCDSSALSSILVANRLCEDAKGTFILCGANEMIEKLLKISQLENIVKCTPTLSEATDYIFMEELERELKSEKSKGKNKGDK